MTLLPYPSISQNIIDELLQKEFPDDGVGKGNAPKIGGKATGDDSQDEANCSRTSYTGVE